MEEHQRNLFLETIRSNFNNLVEHTSCNQRFLDTCLSTNILTEEEHQEINACKNEFGKSSKFYFYLIKKDVESYLKVITILQVHNQSKVAIQILRSCLLEDFRNQENDGKRDEAIFEVCSNIKSARPKEPIVSFTGREDELQSLHSFLTQDDPFCKNVCITGLGGIGKSELAKAYADKYRSFYNKNCLWINADNSESIREDFYTLAEELLISTKTKDGFQRPLSAITSDIYKYLSPVQSLIIFDNVTEFVGLDGICNILPNFPPAVRTPLILMTSRFAKWEDVEDSNVREFPITVLTLENATNFLTKQLDLIIPEDIQNAEKLAAEFDCLPLALQHASAYIRRNINRNPYSKSTLLSSYLSDVKKSEKLIPTENENDKSDKYTNTIYNTWSMTMRKIINEDEDKLAILCLKLLAYRRPFKIRHDTFTNDILRLCSGESADLLRSRMKISMEDVPEDDESISRSINVLADYSMIRVEEGLISFHRLVGQVLILHMKKEQEEEVLLDVIISPMQDLPSEIYDRRRIEICKYWQHVLPYDSLVKKFSRNIAIRVNKDCFYNYPMSETVYRLEKVFGNEHPDTLEMKLIEINQYGRDKDIDKCLEICEELLDFGNELTVGFMEAKINSLFKAKKLEETLELITEKYFAQLRKLDRKEVHTVYLSLFQIGANKVLLYLSKNGTSEEVQKILTYFQLLEGKFKELVSDQISTKFVRICWRGIIVCHLLLDQDEAGVDKFMTGLEIFKTAGDPDELVYQFSEIISFMGNNWKKMDLLFENLHKFWDIAEAGASDKRKMAAWWLKIQEAITQNLEPYTESNKKFGTFIRVNTEPFSNFVPHGIIAPQADFIKIGEGLERYFNASNFIHNVCIRDFNDGRPPPKLSINEEYMSNLVAMLNFESWKNSKIMLPLVVLYDSNQILLWENGKFQATLLKLMNESSDPLSKAQGLKLLHYVLANSTKYTRNSVITTDFLNFVLGAIDENVEGNDVLIETCLSILITLTDDNEFMIFGSNEIQRLGIYMGNSIDKPNLLKYVIWIFANLAESGILWAYPNLGSSVEILYKIIESQPLKTYPGLYFVLSILSHLLADGHEEIEHFNWETEHISRQNVVDIMTHIIESWNQESIKSLLPKDINFNSLDHLFRMLDVDMRKKIPGICRQFATWILAFLSISKPDMYISMMTGYPNWNDLLNDLLVSTECQVPAEIIKEAIHLFKERDSNM